MAAKIPFADLPDDVKAVVRGKQLKRAEERRQSKLRQGKAKQANQPADRLVQNEEHGELPKKKKKKKKKNKNKKKEKVGRSSASPSLPPIISQNDYFAATCGSISTGLPASARGAELLMMQDFKTPVTGPPRNLSLGDFSYFIFEGTPDELWDPLFYARLAWEGFFTITTERNLRVIPLPELQPFYGVVTWDTFHQSKHVHKVLKRLRRMRGGSSVDRQSKDGSEVQKAASHPCKELRMFVNRDFATTYKQLNEYNTSRHGSNWMTSRYVEAMQQASRNPTINFSLLSIELYAGGHQMADVGTLVAGEIGYSIGNIYTSLSGFCTRNTNAPAPAIEGDPSVVSQHPLKNLGNIQMAVLGRWLESKGFAMWSLGHCYAPAMDYKRKLGQRVYPRTAFLEAIKPLRGPFQVAKNTAVCGFRAGEECDIDSVIA